MILNNMKDLEKQEILYNEIYNRTKDFGRSHFIKEIMRLEREKQQLKDRIEKAIEYIENDLQSFLYSIEYKTLLEILKGDKDE